MIEKLILDALLDDTFKRKVENTSRNCLRSRNEKQKCTKCIGICPEGAIESKADGVIVDSLLCGGCNLCVTECYSRTFITAKRPYINALNKIVDLECSNWGCIKTEENSDLSFGCIRAIDPRFLMALSFADLLHEINVDLSKCKGCKYEEIGLDISSLISYIKDNGNLENLTIHEKSNISKKEEELSRRDFLGAIFKESKTMSKSAIKEATKNFGIDLETEENIDALIIVLLKKGISKDRESSWMKEYIFDLSVDKNCTFCYECVSYCPTKALSIENTKEYQSLSIDPELCNFCGRCIEKCNYNSISKAEFTGLKKSLMYEKKKAKCKGCMIYSTSLNEEGYCITCEIRNKNRKRN